MEELTYVPVGTDRFRAQVTAEACLAAGLSVELLASDDSGTYRAYGGVQPHRLLVRTADLEQVLAIVQRSDSTHHSDRPGHAP